MKKIYLIMAFVLTAVMIFCVASCVGTDEETTTAKSEVTTEKAEATTAEMTTVGESSEAESKDETENSSETDSVTETETEAVSDTESESITDETTSETDEETTEGETETYEEFVAPDGTVYKRNQYGVIYNEDGTINAYSWHYYLDAVQYNGELYDSVQEAMDAVVAYLKENLDATYSQLRVSIKNDIDFQVANTGVDEDDYTLGPVYVNVPDDGNFYGLYYNLHRCDLRFSIGVTYDDGNTPVPGLAYYSLLWVLDKNMSLDGTHVFIWSDNEGFTPGYYEMRLKDGHEIGDDGKAIAWDYEEFDYNYEYIYVGSLDDYWHYHEIER